MYDFAHPVSDAIEGITHSLCSLEFENHFLHRIDVKIKLFFAGIICN